MQQPFTDPDLIEHLDDHSLIAAYEATGGVPGDADADALLTEIRRRGLDV